MTKLGVHEVSIDSLPPPNTDGSFAVLLEAEVQALVPVPSGSKVVVFASDLTLWVSVDQESAITIPAATDLVNCCPMYNPPGLCGIEDVTNIHLISATGGIVNVQFYS